MSSEVQAQADKVRALKAAHVPQVEVTAAIEELKRLKAKYEQQESKKPAAEQPAQNITLEAAAEKIRSLKDAHASQADVSQAIAVYNVLKETHSLDPVAVAAERIRVLKAALAPADLVVAAIQEHKKASEQPAVVTTPTLPTNASATNLPTSAAKPKSNTNTPTVDSLAQKVVSLKASGAPQEQVATAVAELTSLKNHRSVDPQVVSEEKIKVLKAALAPVASVQRAIDEHKSLKKQPATNTSNDTATRKEEKVEKKEVAVEQKRSSTGGVVVAAGVSVFESENFEDFQARLAKRFCPHQRAFVDERGFSAPISNTAAASASDLGGVLERSEHADKRIQELSVLCEKMKMNVNPANLQQLRTENAKAVALNASLRKSLQAQEGGGAAEKKEERKTTLLAPPASASSAASASPAFAAWQAKVKAASFPSSAEVGWPGEFWLVEAKRLAAAAKGPSDLSLDPLSGEGRALQFLCKQLPLPK